jgi:hypothetical protein
VSWRGDIEFFFFKTARSQYFEILKDWRVWGIALDPSWYKDLIVVNTIDHAISSPPVMFALPNPMYYVSRAAFAQARLRPGSSSA